MQSLCLCSSLRTTLLSQRRLPPIRTIRLSKVDRWRDASVNLHDYSSCRCICVRDENQISYLFRTVHLTPYFLLLRVEVSSLLVSHSLTPFPLSLYIFLSLLPSNSITKFLRRGVLIFLNRSCMIIFFPLIFFIVCLPLKSLRARPSGPHARLIWS